MNRRQFLTLAGFMAIPARAPFTLRRSILPRVEAFAQRFGYYTSYQLANEEYVGEVRVSDDQVEPPIVGYEVNALSALKYHPRTNAPDDGSWRRVDADNPRWQWHVHIWIDDESQRFDVFSHYEFRPDTRPIGSESITDMKQRLRDHYRPTWDLYHDPEDSNYFLGEACSNVLEAVE